MLDGAATDNEQVVFVIISLALAMNIWTHWLSTLLRMYEMLSHSMQGQCKILLTHSN